MKFRITGDWNQGFKHDGLLYCAQRIEELLMDYTSHLYKTPVNNSFLLAMEFIHVYPLVRSEEIDKTHLENILNEFIDTFSSDIVVRDHLSDHQIQYFIGRLKGEAASSQLGTMNYLLRIMENYQEWCVEALKQTLSIPKEKKKIERVLKAYIPMLVGLEYQPRFIREECVKLFTNPSITGTEVVDDFCARFDNRKKEFTVYFLLSKRFGKFRSILSSRLEVEFDEDEYSKKLLGKANNYISVHTTVKALDVDGAARRAFENLRFFIDFYKFLGNRYCDWCGTKCLVVDEKGHYETLTFGDEHFSFSQNYDDITLGLNSERVITKLLENASYNNIIMIHTIVSEHNSALSCPNIKNAFLNLWSILEIVGTENSSEKDSKVQKVIKNIIPVLQRNYIRQIVQKMHDYLKGNLNSEQYKDVISKVTEDGTEAYKIACLITLEKYKEARKETCIILKNYPVIRSRICILYEDVFKRKKLLKTKLDKYEKRLTWHIQRLYRVRNEMIHAGESESNIVYLVEHLHSYVDEVVSDLIVRMTSEPSLGSVSSVLIDAQVYMERVQRMCTDDGGFTAQEIKDLLA